MKRKRKQRVALRRKSRDSRNRRAKQFLLWSLAFFLVFAGARFSLDLTGEILLQKKFLAVKEIQVEGALTMSKNDLRSASGLRIGDPLFRAKRDHIVQSVREKYPQISEATVRRFLWGTVLIQVSEREPVAVMLLAEEGPHALDAEGNLYATSVLLEGLPELIPCEPQAMAAAARFLHLAKKERLFDDLGIVKMGMEAPRDDVFFFLKDGTKISWGALDEERFQEKYQRLRWVMNQVFEKNGGLAYANLRYYSEGKIIVKPKEITTGGGTHGKI